jgi:NitT/TauT family transport system substrate-binding protein
MNFSKRFAFVLLVVCVLAGCKKEEPATVESVDTGPVSVKLQLNWKPEPQFGGFYAAQEAGAYAKHGLAVDIRPGGSSAPTVDMLGAGTVEFALVSGDEIIRARSNGNRIVALFAVYQTNPQGIMTRASRGFTSLADVFRVPGTLAIEKGLPYSEFLKQKYDFDKLTLVPSPFGDLSLYRTKEDYAMQCFVTSEPLAAAKTGIAPRTFLIADSGYNPYTTVLATSDDLLTKNPKVVADMTAAVREGWATYLADPSPTNAIMQKLNPTMDAETFTASAEAQKPLVAVASTPIGSMTLERWQTLVTQLSDLKAISNPVDPKSCFVPTN